MPIRNRDTLKRVFSEGQKPTEEDFKNLIDSTVNILDDGFSKNSRMGIKLAPLSEKEGTVMTFLQTNSKESQRWEVAVVNHEDLRISRINDDKTQQLIVLKNNGDIEIGSQKNEVRIAGTVKSDTRKGTFRECAVPADGKWHDATELLRGICAFEVVAVCGKIKTGKHAVIVAMATHCFGSKARIRKVSSHYGSFMNRLKLRWVTEGDAAKLQVRTISMFGPGIDIHCNITQLWDDRLMEKTGSHVH